MRIVANAQSMRQTRKDEDRMAKERKANAAAHRKAREDEERREKERVADLAAHRKARENEERREKERVADSAAHKMKWDNVNNVMMFLKLIEQGPTNSCKSCDGLFFNSSIKTFRREQIVEKYGEIFCNTVIRPLDDSLEVLCGTCHLHIHKGRIPK